MCGNYGIGGHYWMHPDYHNDYPEHYLPGSSGNRVATILTVLESPKAGKNSFKKSTNTIDHCLFSGGATVWPRAGISVFGPKGAGLFWHNLLASGRPDEYTYHSACPVLLGQKWIGNKWVGYNAQWQSYKKCQKTFIQPFPPLVV